MATEFFDFEFDLDKVGDRLYHQSKGLNFASALDRGLESGYKDLVDRMIDKLIENLTKYELDSGDIIGQVDVTITDDGVSLILKDGVNDYAIFVEYGTGVVGESNPHPQPSRNGWVYDINEHGDSGWWYPSRESDPNPTRTMTKSGDWIAWTSGMPSRPFMYDTWRWTTSSATQIIDSHIKREFRKLERDSR